MKHVPRLMLGLYLILLTLPGRAQEMLQGNGKPEMAVGMRANGKIYVVVAVVVTILAGLVAYLVNLDRKISKLEKEAKA